MIRRAGMLLRSSASWHMPSRWPVTPNAASPTTSTSPVVVQLSVVAIKEVAHGSSQRPRRAAPAPVSAHQAAWLPGAALAPPQPTRPPWTDGSDGLLSGRLWVHSPHCRAPVRWSLVTATISVHAARQGALAMADDCCPRRRTDKYILVP